MKEIGSCFWSVEKTIPHDHWWDNLGDDRRFFISGRTALYALIDDICSRKNPQSVCMPDYCCESMVLPFIQHNIKVNYYHVEAENGTLHFETKNNNSCDIFYLTNYFGYSSESMLELAGQAKNIGSIVIYDCTQSVLTPPPKFADSVDYIFGSFRKFSGLIGGVLIKNFGRINLDSNYTWETNYEYVRKEKLVSELKKKYIESGAGDKSVFLRLRSEAEKILDDDYIRFNIDNESKILFTVQITGITKKLILITTYIKKNFL